MMKRYLVLGAALVLLFAAGIVVRSSLSRAASPKRSAYTLTSHATQYDSDGASRDLYTETMYMSASGNWRSIKQYASGARVDTFGVMGQGVFAKREGETKLNFLSRYDSVRPILTGEGFQKSVNYRRTESVMGYETFVTTAENNPQVEFYSAPIIGGAHLKIVHKSESKTVIIEPMSLVFGEPAPALLQTPGGLPVSMEHFNRIHDQ